MKMYGLINFWSDFYSSLIDHSPQSIRNLSENTILYISHKEAARCDRDIDKRKKPRRGDDVQIFCRTKESPAWHWNEKNITVTKQARTENNHGGKNPVKKKEDMQTWEVGDTIYVDIATWYSQGMCPFPANEKWFCRGIVTRVYKRAYDLVFPCFDDTPIKKGVRYMTVGSVIMYALSFLVRKKLWWFWQTIAKRELCPGGHIVEPGDDKRFEKIFLEELYKKIETEDAECDP